MNKTIYIIPELGSKFTELRYEKLAKILQDKGYKVIKVKPDWYKPISIQTFDCTNSSIIGFSMGAVIAYLCGKKYPNFNKIVLASISPIEDFTNDLSKHMSWKKSILIMEDYMKIKIKLNNKFITISGELENMDTDIIVPKTRHYLSDLYIRTISLLF